MQQRKSMNTRNHDSAKDIKKEKIENSKLKKNAYVIEKKIPITVKSVKPDDCESKKPDICKSIKPDICMSVKPDHCKSVKPDHCKSVKPDKCKSIEPDYCSSAGGNETENMEFQEFGDDFMSVDEVTEGLLSPDCTVGSLASPILYENNSQTPTPISSRNRNTDMKECEIKKIWALILLPHWRVW